MVDQNRIPLLEKFLQQAGGRDVKRLQKLVKRAGLDESGRTLSADRQELRRFHSFWEVVVEALRRFPDTALRLIEKEPIDELLWRASLFNFLVDKRTPLLSLSELQDVTHSFVKYLEVNRVSLVRNGYPENYFPDSLWLNRNLSFLYYQKLPQSGGTRLLNEREISLHLLSPNDFVRLVLPKKDVVEREDLGVTAKKAAIEMLKEAGLVGQFSEEEITQLRNCREDLLEMKIAVLNTVERALERHDPDNLVLNCLDSIEERLDGDDVAFLLRLDKSYHNTDQINVRRMTRRNWERSATSITPRPGGLTDLLFAIGHYAKELRIGTFAKTWGTLGYRYNPVNRIHYLDFVASSSTTLVRRDQIDKALNLYDRLAGEEEEFWKDYTREINDFLKTKSGERRLGRIVFRTKELGRKSQDLQLDLDRFKSPEQLKRLVSKLGVDCDEPAAEKKKKPIPEAVSYRRALVKAFYSSNPNTKGKNLDELTCEHLDRVGVPGLHKWKTEFKIETWAEGYKHSKIKKRIQKMFSGDRGKG